jgi:N-methylhydantoinase B
LDREPNRVLEDVRDGYVTVDGARRDYGVVIIPRDGDFMLDKAATRSLRSERKSRSG